MTNLFRRREPTREDPSNQCLRSQERNIFSGESKDRADQLPAIESTSLPDNILWKLKVQITPKGF
jgi:hypothetical protein